MLVAFHALATIAMTAVIWFVQLVHYPLFARVGAPSFVAYEAEHVTRITWIVMPLMVLELLTSAAFVVRISSPYAIAGVVLLGVIWLSTAFLQVPLHRQLEQGFDTALHARLVSSNWIRTVAWTLRTAILFAPWAGSILHTR